MCHCNKKNEWAGVHFKLFCNSPSTLRPSASSSHPRKVMSTSDAHVQVDVPVYYYYYMSKSRRIVELLEDSRNRKYHDSKNHRYRIKTVLIGVVIVALLRVQYNNSMYTLSFVRSIASIDSVVNFQRIVSIEETKDTSVTARAESVDEKLVDDTPSTPRRRVLIAQYTASSAPLSPFSTNIYDQFLWMTSNINAAYAVKWKHDFWIMRGIAFRNPNITGPPQYYTIEKRIIDGQPQTLCTDDCWNNRSIDDNQPDDVPQSRSTYNKVAILEMVLMQNEYDGLLLLDADAMMYDFSRDIAGLLSPNSVLIAHKTNNSEGAHTGSINIGVTLWNLRNKLTPYVAQRWKSSCLRRIIHHSHDKLDDDQAPLQFILKHELDQTRRNKVVYAIENEFYYARGTFIRHFIRPAGSVWTNHSVDSEATRLLKIQRSAHEVCTTYRLHCDDWLQTKATQDVLL